MLSSELKNRIKASVKMEVSLMENVNRLLFPAGGSPTTRHTGLLEKFLPQFTAQDERFVEALCAPVGGWIAYTTSFTEGDPFNAPMQAWLKEQSPEVVAGAKELAGLKGVLLRLDRKLGRCHGDVFSYLNLLTGENGILAEGIGNEAVKEGDFKEGQVVLGAAYRTGPITMAVLLTAVPSNQADELQLRFEAMAAPGTAADFVAENYPAARLDLLRLARQEQIREEQEAVSTSSPAIEGQTA
jgi:hypothetical protein